jgi:hypothetical protein
MANPFDKPNHFEELARLLAGKQSEPDKSAFGSLLDGFNPMPQPRSALASLFGESDHSALPTGTNALAGYNNYVSRRTTVGALPVPKTAAQTLWPLLPSSTAATEPVKRKAFFSFHYADIMRVNNVRNEGKIGKRSTERNFYDRSLWESKKLEGPEALKRLIRQGMEHASAVCVLIGTETHSRRWVRYEIARAIVDQRGLFGVHINGLRHHERRQPDPQGFNPFNQMGIYRDFDGKFYIWEENAILVDAFANQWEWHWQHYADYVSAVTLPKYMTAPPPGQIMPLSAAVDVYDYCDPQRNLGAWIDRAAVRAGY